MKRAAIIGLSLLGAAIGVPFVVALGVVLLVVGAGVAGGDEPGGSAGATWCGDLDGLGLAPEQIEGVEVIAEVGGELEVSEDGLLVAVVTALAESNIRMLANDGAFQRPAGSGVMPGPAWLAAAEAVAASMDYPHDGVGRDWDSVNFFQQRPSAGWGSVADLMDPHYSARAFFGGPGSPNGGSPRGLLDIAGWQEMSTGEAAQAVQVSAFPEAYDRHLEFGQQIVDAVSDVECDTGGVIDPPNADGWVHPAPQVVVLTGRYGHDRGSYIHWGEDLAAPEGSPILAPADGVVAHTSCSSFQGRSPCNILIDHGGGLESLMVHMWPNGVHVDQGDAVEAGEHVADVGNNGNSTGPHLHYELWQDGTPIDPSAFFSSVGIDLAHP